MGLDSSSEFSETMAFSGFLVLAVDLLRPERSRSTRPAVCQSPPLPPLLLTVPASSVIGSASESGGAWEEVVRGTESKERPAKSMQMSCEVARLVVVALKDAEVKSASKRGFSVTAGSSELNKSTTGEGDL